MYKVVCTSNSLITKRKNTNSLPVWPLIRLSTFRPTTNCLSYSIAMVWVATKDAAGDMGDAKPTWERPMTQWASVAEFLMLLYIQGVMLQFT